MQLPQRYLIKSIQNPGFCLGVQSDPAEGSPIVLAVIGARYTAWLLDEEEQTISLADAPHFKLSVPGPGPANTVQLCLLPLLSDSQNQQWDWISQSPFIVTTTEIGGLWYVVDNRNGTVAQGNPIQAYQQLPGDANQAWMIFPLEST